jgi:uncharacterized membrane protein
MTPEIPEADLTVDTSPLIKCYGILILAMPLTYVMNMMVAAAAFLVLIMAVNWGRKLRRREEPLFKNHGRWIRRTFWQSMAFTCIAVIVCWSVFSSNADNTGMEALAQGLQAGTLTPDDVQMEVDAFYVRNADLIFWDWVVCFTPVVLYAVARYVKGYRLADAGKPVPNVTSWWI